MDWASALPALLGTVVGGAITLAGAYFADRRREVAAKGTEDRASIRAATELKRQQVRELHDRICEDLAWIRSETQAALQLPNLDGSEALDEVVVGIGIRRDRAGSVVAIVSDAAVRDAADAFYDQWAKWCVAESSRLVNGGGNPVDAKATLGASATVAQAVRAHLRALDPIG